EIEHSVRSSKKFRRSARSAWFHRSPHADDVTRLLFELDEWRPVIVEFVGYPRDLDETEFAWRALSVRTTLSPTVVASLLRRLADFIESGDMAGMRSWS